MRILFVLRHAGFVRNYEAVLRELAGRGHAVHLAFELPRADPRVAGRLAQELKSITWGSWSPRADRWAAVAASVRPAIDYRRYLTPEYAAAPKLRARGRAQAPAVLAALAERLGPRGRDRLDRTLRAIDRALPPDAQTDAWLAERRPDLVLVAPLVAGPWQQDVVDSARRAGIACGLPVTSWDNLTNKGLIRRTPDAVYVWNEAQREEALQLHGVQAARVHVVGAHSYDHWFQWRPSSSREAFYERLGFDPRRPIVLYLCSSKFVAAHELGFVKCWLAALRAHSGALAGVNVLVRPHPASGAHWAGATLDAADPVAVWPPVGDSPDTDEAKRQYFDSMHHCVATVGLNTSAIIESAILGRPSFTVLDPEFAGSQEGTLHFAYLRREQGGPLTASAGMAEHLEALEQVVQAGGASSGWQLPFVTSFVRPQGLEHPAAPALADALEALAVSRPQPPPARTLDQRLIRPLLPGLAAAASFTGRRRRRARRRARARMRKRLRRTARRLSRRLRRPRPRHSSSASRSSTSEKGSAAIARTR